MNNAALIIPEIAVIGLALAILLIDLWTPAAAKPRLGYLAAVGLALILFTTFGSSIANEHETAGFSGLFVNDALSLYFKRFFLVAALLVILLGAEFADRIKM